jgi:hypothetical protein
LGISAGKLEFTTEAQTGEEGIFMELVRSQKDKGWAPGFILASGF